MAANNSDSELDNDMSQNERENKKLHSSIYPICYNRNVICNKR